MLVSFIIQLVTSALSWIFHLLPTFSMPSWVASGTVLPGGVASAIGGALAAVAPFLPVSFVLTVISTVLLMLPAVGGFLIFTWVWRHVPTIAGFGTGDG